MAENKKTIEEVMADYAKTQENAGGPNASTKVSPAQKVAAQPQAPTAQDEFAQRVRENQEGRQSLAEAQRDHQAEVRQEVLDKKLGYLEIPVEDLPTGGIFYPDGTKINVRAASGGDIRHWSMMNETELSQIDDALNYMIERCVNISNPTVPMTWKDIKEIDRFYLILCVRDFTFTEGHNELKIDVSENEQVVVKKDNITFMDLDDNMMKYYNKDKKCFTFTSKTPTIGELNFYMPCIGVTQWLKQYIEKKTRTQEPFDRDFITVAPMLIKDYRQLNDRSYTDLIMKSMDYGIKDWTLISKVKKILEKAVTPKMTYTDESGVEHETPLNFHGGIKSIFLDNDVDKELGI